MSAKQLFEVLSEKKLEERGQTMTVADFFRPKDLLRFIV